MVAQINIAGQCGDEQRLRELRLNLLANPLIEQNRERYNAFIGDVLSLGWEARFDAVRALVDAHAAGEAPSAGAQAMFDALRATAALGTGHFDEVRRLARQAIAESVVVSGVEPAYERRRRIVARLIAAIVCILIGDAIRGRRALSREFDPAGCFVNAVDSRGIAEGGVPDSFRGYARLCNVAFAAASRSRPPLGLTAAEVEVLRGLTTGATARSVASALGKSEKTVQHQVESIYRKLNVKNRVQAVERAREAGLADPLQRGL